MYEHITESGHRTHFPPWCWWSSGLKGRGAVWLVVVPWCKAGSCTKYLLLFNAPPKVSTHMDILTQYLFMNRTYIVRHRIEWPEHEGFDDHTH